MPIISNNNHTPNSVNDAAIAVENVGKRYLIRHERSQREVRYRTFRDAVTESITNLFNRQKTAPKKFEDFWALNDVNFHVEQGEVIGLIGRNGAGKSTMLKILSRITEPTSGRIVLNGRIASLLEVGTGFHPELTGRENIFMNGAILGMTKSEIKRKFDEIVAFADIERFLDTPVKRYSSGMGVRLGFAVAAHLEPEILLIDEVLAVGDAAFQKKCLGKMGEVATQEGRTIIFVSHNMASIQRLCSRVVVLEQGRVSFDGDTEEAVKHYLASGATEFGHRFDLKEMRRDPRKSSTFTFTKCAILDSDGRLNTNLRFGEPFSVYLEAEAKNDFDYINIMLAIESATHTRITTVKTDDQEMMLAVKAGEPVRLNLHVDQLKLYPGRYTIMVTCRKGNGLLDRVENAATFEVTALPYDEEFVHNNTQGFVRGKTHWEIAETEINPEDLFSSLEEQKIIT